MLANMGFINAMTAKFNFSSTSKIDNRDTVLIFDRDCHWSLWKAAAHLKFGEQLLTFRHNDIADLERVLGLVGSKRPLSSSKAFTRPMAVWRLSVKSSTFANVQVL